VRRGTPYLVNDGNVQKSTRKYKMNEDGSVTAYDE